jgi:hypothetical protein
VAQAAQVAQVAQTKCTHDEIQTTATEPEAKYDLTSLRFFADPHACFGGGGWTIWTAAADPPGDAGMPG